jgi:hypothetical protein
VFTRVINRDVMVSLSILSLCEIPQTTPWWSIRSNVVKTIINYPFGNGKLGKHTTYKNGDDWGMVHQCFNHIIPCWGVHFLLLSWHNISPISEWFHHLKPAFFSMGCSHLMLLVW